MLDSTTIAVASVAISLVSLGVASATMYLTWLRRGRLKMTRPSVIAIAFEGIDRIPKIILRTVLYSTAPRGKMIESMHVKVCHGASEEAFTFWGYGETTKLVPGGLHVGQNGVAAYHHFVRSKRDYWFEAGDYTIKVFARQPGDRAPAMLAELELKILADKAMALGNYKGVRFEMQPDSLTYVGRIDD